MASQTVWPACNGARQEGFGIAMGWAVNRLGGAYNKQLQVHVRVPYKLPCKYTDSCLRGRGVQGWEPSGTQKDSSFSGGGKPKPRSKREALSPSENVDENFRREASGCRVSELPNTSRVPFQPEPNPQL